MPQCHVIGRAGSGSLMLSGCQCPSRVGAARPSRPPSDRGPRGLLPYTGIPLPGVTAPWRDDRCGLWLPAAAAAACFDTRQPESRVGLLRVRPGPCSQARALLSGPVSRPGPAGPCGSRLSSRRPVGAGRGEPRLPRRSESFAAQARERRLPALRLRVGAAAELAPRTRPSSPRLRRCRRSRTATSGLSESSSARRVAPEPRSEVSRGRRTGVFCSDVRPSATRDRRLACRRVDAAGPLVRLGPAYGRPGEHAEPRPARRP